MGFDSLCINFKVMCNRFLDIPNCIMIFAFSQCSGNGKAASWGAVVGFLIMMALDVGLG